MKRYNTGYYIKEGATGIFSHGFMSFASVCIIVACLIIMGSFSLMAVNVNSIIDEFKKQNQLLAYVNDTMTVDEARALESQIEAIPNVDHATFITNKEAMDIFTSKYQDQSVFDSMEEDVLRHRYEVYMRDISLTEQTQNDLKAINGIAKVGANLEISKGLMTISKIVSGVSFIIIAILLFISLFIMSNTIKLATFDRRDEIAIMKIVGATNRFIRWPFVFQGFILGIVGSLTAFIAQWVIYALVIKMIVKANTLGFISPIPFSAVALPMFFVFLAVGFGVGVVGSLIAIKNYLRV